MDELSPREVSPIDIRVLRRKETGSSRGLAFIEFNNAQEAQQWMASRKGTWVLMGRYDLSLSYSDCKPPLACFPEDGTAQDWTCSKCNTFNFKKRNFCFRCSISREEVLAEKGLNQIGSNPCNTLLFRGLDLLTDDTSLISGLSAWTRTPLKNLHIMRDKVSQMSKGFAFVEFSSVAESRKVFDELCFGEKPLEIDGKEIVVDFARNTFDTIMSSMDSFPQKPAAPVSNVYQADTANAGAAAAQAGMNKATKSSENRPSNYVYDDKSGYYYDTLTGLFYDPVSTYFYNPMTGQYLLWNGTSYVLPPSAEPEKKPKQEKTEVKAEVRAAKKIKRDMDKWASAQNGKSTRELPEKEDLVNWTRLVCLLCRRQFNSREVLEKHVKMSQLHAKNLEEMNKPNVVEQSGFVEIGEDRTYRDRAKERRDKFGISEPPGLG